MSRYGFLSKDGASVFLQRCPECERENWAMAVASGQCAWCGYQGKKEDVTEKQGKQGLPKLGRIPK